MLEPKGNTPDPEEKKEINGNENPEQKNEEGKTPEEGEGKKPAEKLFNQEEVNAIVAREKREHNDRIKKLKDAGLSDDQIDVLEKQQTKVAASGELEAVRKERVQLILDKNKDLSEKLDPQYKAKLLAADPVQVEEMFSNIRKAVTNEGGKQPQTEGGELESLEGGKETVKVKAEDQNLVEGIDHFTKTQDPSKMVEGLMKKLGI
jgi:hypothetical protein